MKRPFACLVLAVFLLAPVAMAGESVARANASTTGPEAPPLTRAHAHNDYNHETPLLDALSHGFCSVEADVFLVDGKLLVGHSRSELDAGRTLETSYLDPLLDLSRRNDGRVFQNGPGFTLLVDIKTDGEATYRALDTLLETYEEMVTTFSDGEIRSNAVTVIISGNRAWDVITHDPTRFAAVDGRLPDLMSDRSWHLMPLVSDSWEKVFTWSGAGPMAESERTELNRIVAEAHARDRRVRFWATPDVPSPERTAVWNELVDAGVDLIGTDDLEGLADFLRAIEDRD